jgi:hypothetical protein
MSEMAVLAEAAAAVREVPGWPRDRGEVRSGGKKEEERWWEREER